MALVPFDAREGISLSQAAIRAGKSESTELVLAARAG